PMSPAHTRKRDGRAYHYYVSSPLLTGRPAKVGAIPRVPAFAIEDLVQDRLQRLAGRMPVAASPGAQEAAMADADAHAGAATPRAVWQSIRQALRRVEIGGSSVTLTVDPPRLCDLAASLAGKSEPPSVGAGALRSRLPPGDRLIIAKKAITLTIP